MTRQFETFEELAAAYPVRQVDAPPAHYRFKEDDRYQAEKARDWVEETDEVAAEVVQHAGTYYIIYKD